MENEGDERLSNTSECFMYLHNVEENVTLIEGQVCKNGLLVEWIIGEKLDGNLNVKHPQLDPYIEHILCA